MSCLSYSTRHLRALLLHTPTCMGSYSKLNCDFYPPKKIFKRRFFFSNFVIVMILKLLKGREGLFHLLTRRTVKVLVSEALSCITLYNVVNLVYNLFKHLHSRSLIFFAVYFAIAIRLSSVAFIFNRALDEIHFHSRVHFLPLFPSPR